MRWLAYPYYRLRMVFMRKRFDKCLRDELAEEFLKTLLNLISLAIALDCSPVRRLLHWLTPGRVSKMGPRDRLRHFDGAIEFRSRDRQIRVVAAFGNNRLTVTELAPGEQPAERANIRVVFKDAAALMNYLLPRGGLDGKRDILGALLKNELVLDGNFNYIYRFGFLANHVQLQFKRALQ